MQLNFVLSLIFCSLILSFHGQSPDTAQVDSDTSSIVADTSIISHRQMGIIDSVLTYAEKYLGVPYGFGSMGTKTFDCSGYVCHVYGKHNIVLPHGSASQSALCKDVKRKNVEPGDLVFFSGRKVSKSTIGHVAIVHHIEDDEIFVIHATVQAGVIIESMDKSAYFAKRFIRFGRLPENKIEEKTPTKPPVKKKKNSGK